MPVVCKTRPIELWDNISGTTPYSIEHFNASKNAYDVAAGPSSEIPFPYPHRNDLYYDSGALRNCIASVTTFANDPAFERAVWEHPFAPEGVVCCRRMRVGLESEARDIASLICKAEITTREKNPAAWKEAANYYQGLFERESRRKGTYVRFRIEIIHHACAWYDGGT